MTRALPTVNDVAARAGVSTATVDRVLHRRPGVRQATVQRVLQAASDLDYLPAAELDATLVPRPLELLFVLPERGSRYLQMLSERVRYSRADWAPMNVNCRVAQARNLDPEALATVLRRRGRRYDGVAMMAIEHPAVREAVDVLSDHNVPVVTLVSDLPHSRRIGYVGLDNRAAGRTAAYLIARFVGTSRRAKIALIAGSRSYCAHQERESGFMQLLEEQYPQMQVVSRREGHDDPRSNHRQMRAVLEQHPDLAAVYNIGGGAEGVGRALKERGREASVVFIGHGLTPDSRALLVDGTMDALINQSAQAAIMNCVRIFANLRARRDLLSGVETTRSQVLLRENLP